MVIFALHRFLWGSQFTLDTPEDALAQTALVGLIMQNIVCSFSSYPNAQLFGLPFPFIGLGVQPHE